MASAVEWVMRLADRVSAPASAMQKRIEAVENVIRRVESVTKRSGGAFGGWARQGEQSALRIEKAYERVQRRVQGTHQSAQGLMQSLQGGLMVGGAALAGMGFAGKSIVDAAAYKQDQLIGLTGMMKGNRDRAARLFDQAQAFAAATPFTTRQILDATRQSVAIGFDSSQAVPLVKLAGSLSAGSGKSMDQVMEAFAALRGGDFGQAFGIGQGFSNLNISRDMLRRAGLRFDAQGSYKGSVQQGINAVAKIIHETYGGALGERGKSISGLASTLQSRPEELFMSLVDSKGQSKALAPMQRFMANLAELTDFSKPPGSRIQKRFEQSMTKLFGAIFNPLADATAGKNGIALIDRMLDKLDEFSAWWTQHGPGITANLKGFGEGLMVVANGAWKVLDVLGRVTDKLSGGSGEGGAGKLLGMLAGGALAAKLANTLTFGLTGKAANWVGRSILGGIKGGLNSLKGQLMKGWGASTLARSVKGMGWLRALGITGSGGLLGTAPAALGGMLVTVTKFLPVIGWITTLLSAMDLIGKQLYGTFEPFRQVVDLLGVGLEKIMAILPGHMKFLQSFGLGLLQGKGFGGALADAWGAFTGLPGGGSAPAAPVPTPGLGSGPNASINALTGVAKRLGIDPQALLAVAFKESSLNPAAVNGVSGASGLIQFLPSTAAAYGLTPEQVRGMTPEQQAPYIERYLREAGVRRGSSLEQIYAAVFAGNASKAGRVLYSRGSEAYANNEAMDLDRNGEITSAEVAGAAASAWQAAAGTFAPAVTVVVQGPVTGQAVQDIGQTVHSTLGSLALEHGFGGAQ